MHLALRRTLLLAATVLGGGCFLDPTCRDSCDGDSIKSCDWDCSGGYKIDIPRCTQRYGGARCSDQLGPTGQPKTCKLRQIGAGSETAPFCVDAHLPKCDPTVMLQCIGPQAIGNCIRTTEGGFMEELDYGKPSPDAGKECQQATSGVAWVDSPKQACTPEAFPKCLDAQHSQFCYATADGGYFRSTTACPSPLSCVQDPGSTLGRCR